MINRIGAQSGSISSGEGVSVPSAEGIGGCLSCEGDGEMVDWLIREAGTEDGVTRQFFSDLARIAGAIASGDLPARMAGAAHSEFTEINAARDHAVRELKAKALEVKSASEDVVTATATMEESLRVPERPSGDWTTRMSEAFERASTCSGEASRVVATIAELGVRTDSVAREAGEEAARAVSLSRGLGVLAHELGQMALHLAESAHDSAKLTEEAVQSARRSGALGTDVREYLAVIDHRIGSFRELSARW